MTTLKQGDLIKDEFGNDRNVMGVCGGVRFISSLVKHKRYGFTSDEETLKEDGYTWDTPAWEPPSGMKYWYIDTSGDVFNSTWDKHAADFSRKDFLGIYQTKELCEAALLEIRRKLGK